MKYLIVLSFAAVALARPQYNYPGPQASVSAGPSISGALVTFGNGGGGATGGFGGSGFIGGGGSGPVQVQVTKDIYVHVAPEDNSEQFNSGGSGPAVARKNYKIIFIKAPSNDAAYQQQLGAALQRTEEKTIVYVLSKRPEALEQVDSAGPGGNQTPTKPEVYFIKYKAQSQGK